MASAARTCIALLARRGHPNGVLISIAPQFCKTSAVQIKPLPFGGARSYSSYDKKSKNELSGSSSSDSSDSDGDSRHKRPKGKRGQSEFWLRKMRTHHVAMDINKDGVVSWDDFQNLIHRFYATGILKEPEKAKLAQAIKSVWEEQWGASGDPYAFINQEQFLSKMEHVVNDDEQRKKVVIPLPYFFQAVDHDGSGEICVDEFKLYFKCLGLSEEDAIVSFCAIDTNNDGKLSIKEFVKHGREFFLSEDETRPSKLFWGPLV